MSGPSVQTGEKSPTRPPFETRAISLLALLLLAVGCGPESSSGERPVSGASGSGDSGGSADGASGASGAGATAGSGQSGASGQAGQDTDGQGTAGQGASGQGASGSGATAGSAGASGSGQVVDFEDCASLSQTADNQVRPVDIIWAVDTTSSLQMAALAVQDNLNIFAQQITSAGIDVRVVMIAETGWSVPFGKVMICIDPPLGNGGCPDSDSNPPAFLKIEDKIENHNALSKFIDHFPDYKDNLRQNAVKYFAVVTDDASDWTAAGFTDALAELNAQNPGYFDVWKFFGVFCTQDCLLACGNGVDGHVYTELIQQTGGVYGDLCAQDFAPVFDALAQTVIGSTTIDCEWEIPPPPAGEIFDREKVNVQYTPGSGGAAQNLYRVSDRSACDPAKGGGWYYDDNDSPTRVLVCPGNCDTIQSDLSARIDVLFGCDTVWVLE